MVLGLLMALAMQAAPAVQDAPAPSKARKARPHAGSWQSDDDYPTDAFRNRQYGTVKYRLTIDATGKPTACHLMGSSGYSSLDEKTCPLIRNATRFDPARDDAGKDIASDLDGTFTWSFPNGPSAPNPVSMLASEPVELSVGLQAVPKSYAHPALLRLVYAGDKPKGCTVETSTGNVKLDEIACEQAKAQVEPLKIDDAKISRPDTRMIEARFEVTK